MSGLLSAIPRDIDMADAEADVLAEGSPADQAWHLLCAQHGVDWVIAGKLLARKRPRLLPVYDKVVRCALGRPRPRSGLRCMPSCARTTVPCTASCSRCARLRGWRRR